MGPSEATVATSDTRFSSLATSSLPSFSTAVWMSDSGRPRRDRPLATMRPMEVSVDLASVRAPSRSPLWTYSRMLFMKLDESSFSAWFRAR